MNKGEASYLLVYKIDRLTRNAKQGLELRDISLKNNWRIIIPGLDIYDPNTFMALMVLLGLAEQENVTLATRVKEATKKAKDAGMPVGGQRHKMHDISTVKKIYYYKYKGLAAKQIADKLNDIGIESPHQTLTSNRSWSDTKVRGVLNTYKSNGTYRGDIYKKITEINPCNHCEFDTSGY